MSELPVPVVLTLLSVGGVIGMALLAVGGVKNVHRVGFFPDRSAPEAIPWLVAGFAVLVITLGGGVVWGLGA